MSVQLILYPQHYNGYSFTTQNVFNEYVADGYFANGLDLVSGTTHSQPSHAVLATTIPISAWRGWHSTGGTFSSTTAPSTGSAGLTLTSSSADISSTGIFQLIGNLTSGVSYKLTINISSFASGMLFLGNVYNNSWTVSSTNYTNLGNSSTAFVTGQVIAGKITHTFTALGSGDNEVLVLDYQNNNGASLIIDSISIKETQAVPSGIYTDLADGQVICDLYEEEAIPLSLSIDDFKNVAEKTQSYSKDFHLPNTKRNNKIFSHIFEVTRTTTDAFSFNPYVKTKAILKEDSYTLFEGFLQLININDKESEISYNVNLYSEVITLADTLKESNLYDLDFTELEHDYNRTQIKYSWNDSPNTGITYTNPSTSGFRDTNDTVKYPFIDWSHTFLLGSSNLPELNTLEEAFRPCIQVKYLIDRIFQATPFTFQSTLFDSTDFKKLYMDFNWGGDNAPNDYQNTGSAVAFGTSQLLTTSFATIETNAGGFPASFGYSHTGGFTAPNDNAGYTIYTEVYFRGSSNATLEAQWLHTSAATGNTVTYNYNTYTFSGTYDISVNPNITISLDLNDTLVYQAKATGGTIVVSPFTGAALPSPVSYYGSITVNVMTNSVFLQTLRGELSQWEFLKGIMTMFNLISISDRDNPNNIIIEPYADVFINNSNSTQRNWTDKVDISEINLKPLSKLTKKTIFKFVEDDDDYAFNNYKNSAGGHLYGSKKFDGSTAMPNQVSNLIGEEEIIAEPFAATVSKPLEPYLTNFIVPAIYSLNDDGTTEGFENAPRILYNNGVKTLQGADTYKIPLQNGVAPSTETTFLQFSHLTDIPTIVSSPPVATDTRDFHFGECQLISPIGDATINNLYNIYYSPYYDELYHPDTRIMTMKVNLTPADIQNFKFYDTVVVKNREYRVNKIEYKPNALAKVEFILIP